MALLKDVKGFGLPWEESYGFAQAVKVGDTIYVSGQLGVDDQGNMVGPPRCSMGTHFSPTGLPV